MSGFDQHPEQGQGSREVIEKDLKKGSWTEKIAALNRVRQARRSRHQGLDADPCQIIPALRRSRGGGPDRTPMFPEPISSVIFNLHCCPLSV